MAVNGWLKLSRKLKEHWIWVNPVYLKAWLSILMEVNFESKKVLVHGDLIECNRGQSVYSLQTWAKMFGEGWSIQKVRTFFNLLQKDNMIIVEGLKKTTRLTVCNYDTYQNEQHTDNTQPTHSQHTDNTQITTTKEREEYKERKEVKNNKKIEYDFSFVDENFKDSFMKWIEYKKGRAQSYKTQSSLEACYSKLISISNNNPKTAEECVNDSMANNYSGLFPPKKTYIHPIANHTNEKKYEQF